MKKSLNLALMMGILIFGACSTTQDKNPDGTYTADSKEGKTFLGNVGGKTVTSYDTSTESEQVIQEKVQQETPCVEGSFSKDGKIFTQSELQGKPHEKEPDASFDGAISGTRGIYKVTIKNEGENGQSMTMYIGFDYQAGEKNSTRYSFTNKEKLFDITGSGDLENSSVEDKQIVTIE